MRDVPGDPPYRSSMDRRRFLLTSLAGALAAPLAVEAQPAVKVQRIGFLGPRSAPETLPFLEAFRQGLSELGWAEGRNIVIEYRFAEGKDSRLPDLAAELAQVRADVIVAAGTAGTAAAKTATGTIPIVAVSIADPVGSGLVASIARPGGNVTGLSYSVGTETVGKGWSCSSRPSPRSVAPRSLRTRPIRPDQRW
jgi:putative ABC transport system substrate-binding protein